MSMLGEQVCRECKSPLVNDTQNGETICSVCGIVADGQLIDYGPENLGSSEDRIKSARATGYNTYAKHDLGVTTEIGNTSRDFNGRHIDKRIATQMTNLRNWQKWIRIENPSQRRLAATLARIASAAETLGLPKNVLETASILYRYAEKRMITKSKPVDPVAAAILYMACKQCGVVRTVEQISGALSAGKKPKTKLATKYYRTMAMEISQASAPPIPTDKYISKFANMANVDARVGRLALEIAEKTTKTSLRDGKSPQGIAAAYLYISSALLGYGMPQREISDVAGVTEVTIRNRCKDILANYRITIVLQPVRTGA